MDDVSLLLKLRESALREITQGLFTGSLKLSEDVYTQGHHMWEASCALHKENWLREQVVGEIHLSVSLLNCETVGLSLPKGDVFSFAQGPMWNNDDPRHAGHIELVS